MTRQLAGTFIVFGLMLSACGRDNEETLQSGVEVDLDSM